MNTLKDNRDGISVFCSDNNIITKNIIQENTRYGLALYYSVHNKINQNNFLNNEKDAVFCYHPFEVITRTNNNWNYNFWSEPQKPLYLIVGKCRVTYYSKLFGPLEYYPKWYAFDWHPAQEPYEIP